MCNIKVIIKYKLLYYCLFQENKKQYYNIKFFEKNKKQIKQIKKFNY